MMCPSENKTIGGKSMENKTPEDVWMKCAELIYEQHKIGIPTVEDPKPEKRLVNPNATAEDPCHGCPDRNTEKCDNVFCLVGDENDEAMKWRRIAYEFRHVPATMGSCYFHLCEAIVRADLQNSAKLKAAYPQLVHWLQDVDL
jgi:hypothetical protein